jgi:hypothetical protein
VVEEEEVRGGRKPVTGQQENDMKEERRGLTLSLSTQLVFVAPSPSLYGRRVYARTRHARGREVL